MQVLQALGRALQRFLSAWARWVGSRKTLAGKATAVAISLFALCCGLSVITAPFNSNRRVTTAPGIATAPERAAAADAPAAAPSATPVPTREAPEPTTPPEPPTATAAAPTEAPATAVPPTVAPPTAVLPTAVPPPAAAPVNNLAPVGTGGNNGGSTANAFTCIGGCAKPPDPSCAIKGNVNSEGERIYHVPGGSFYGRTDIKPEEGDRWFCTAAEAREAGFRASQK